jgi:hypothetical protein
LIYQPFRLTPFIIQKIAELWTAPKIDQSFFRSICSQKISDLLDNEDSSSVVPMPILFSAIGKSDERNGRGFTLTGEESEFLNEAARNYKMAAYQGDADAQFNYGFCLQEDESFSKNVSKAARYFKMAADQGRLNE